MVLVMQKHRGVGLAAPQVGILKNLIITDLSYEEKKENRTDPTVLVNPAIIKKEGRVLLEEGCLSLPSIYAEIERDEYITVQYQNLEGETNRIELDGYKARMVLHEMDHLHGKLFWDYLGTTQRSLLIKKLKKAQKK